MSSPSAGAARRLRIALSLLAVAAVMLMIVGATSSSVAAYGVGAVAFVAAAALALATFGASTVATGAVVAGTAAVLLAVPWVTRGGESGHVAGRSEGAISWGWQRGTAIVTTGPAGLAITDATLGAARPLDVATDAQVWAARGPLMFVQSRPDGLAAIGYDGLVAWTTEDPAWVPVGAFDDGVVVLRRCAADDAACDLRAIDPTGATRWETTSTVDPVARRAGPIAGPSSGTSLPAGVAPEGRVPSLPSRLVGRDAARTDGSIIEIDSVTGEAIGLAVADQAVAGDGFVVAVTDDSDHCRIDVTTPDADPGRPPVTTTTWTERCEGDPTVIGGNIVVDRRAGGQLVVDGRSGVITRVGTGPAEFVGAPVVTAAGVLYDSVDGWRFGSMNDSRLPFGPGSDWDLMAVGEGVVVFTRPAPSDNPFHDDRMQDVALFDARTGAQCASAQLVGEQPIAVALEGCRALVGFEASATTFLVSST